MVADGDNDGNGGDATAALTLKLLQDCVVGRKRHKEKFLSTDRFSNASASLKCKPLKGAGAGSSPFFVSDHNFLEEKERESQLCNHENEICIHGILGKSG